MLKFGGSVEIEGDVIIRGDMYVANKQVGGEAGAGVLSGSPVTQY